jgi:urease accessory protein
VHADALLILAPDPVQCFADSSYEQRQHFILDPSANLLLVDWISAGRAACGELWNFRHYSSRNEVQRQGKKLLVDALRLDADAGTISGQYRVGRFQCLATVVLLGPGLGLYAQQILEWCNAQPIDPQARVVFSASPLREGVILRMAGMSVEEVGRAIPERVAFVRELLHDDPFSRKW